MYIEEVSVIAHYMREDPVVFARGFMFAVLSARQPFINVPDQLKALDREGGDCPHLFGWKRDAYNWLQEHGVGLWQALRVECDIHKAMWYITRAPGMGVVKGGFVLQMMGFDVACLDSRNSKRENRDRRAYDTRGAGPTNLTRKNGPAFRRLIERYLGEVGGLAQEYWDAWCSDIAITYHMTAQEVSRLHLCVIGKRPTSPCGYNTQLVPCIRYHPADEIPF